MAANTAARFSLVGNNGSNASTAMAPTLTTAANDYTGVSANNKLVWTSGTNGGRIVGLHFEAVGTNVASVARVYINNGATPTTATNNSFVGQLALPITTATALTTTVPIEFYFPGGYLDLGVSWAVYAGLGTTVAAGWVVTPILGGDF